MEQLKERDFINKIKNNQISPYNVYNYDIEYSTFFSTEYYLKHINDTIQKEQPLNILFFDIEVWTNNCGEFPKAELAKYPIVSNCIYSTFEKCYEVFFMLSGENMSKFPVNEIDKLEQQFCDYLIKENYMEENETIKIHICNSELELIVSSWNRIHEIDPLVISGFNSDHFDTPYIYYRLLRLLNNDKEKVAQILSKFSNVKVRKFRNNTIVSIAEYPNSDLRTLYIPRDEGGSNYGRKLSKYSLDYISDSELNLKKLEYGNQGGTIDNFYRDDPIGYLLYNIVDVILCKKLNQKLGHIELHNMIRRIMKVPFSSSLRGSSILFDSFVYYKLQEENKNVRFGIIAERNMEITESEFKQLQRPKIKLVKKETITNVSRADFTKTLFRFPGAYVKAPPKNQFIFEGLIADLDATALYPSMICQQNISFNSFYGKILDPITYRFIELLKTATDERKKLPIIFYSQIATYTQNYVNNRITVTNKTKAIQHVYFIIVWLIDKIINSNETLQNILENQNGENYVILKNYFINLIDLIGRINDEAKEYNNFAHDYLLNGEVTIDYIYIVENINDPTIKIQKILSNQIENYLKEKKISLSLSGALFYTHEKEEGLFTEFLKETKLKRDNYKNERDKYEKNNEKYIENDRRQASVKILMNTTYGLFGMAGYRFSHRELAQAITIQGRLALKLSQQIGENILNNLLEV